MVILTRRARPKEGFPRYGVAKAVGPVTLKSLPYLSLPMKSCPGGKVEVFPRGRSRV